MKKIPVTILTGFLGAGKTTLLNSILRTHHGKKIAVIENEIGSISIDSDLVVRTEEGLFELSNGCLCCTLNEELITVLSHILETAGDRLDHLVIETTGLADPGPVALSFLSDIKFQSFFQLNAIVCLVDVCHFLERFQDTPEVAKQIAQSDLILLTKTDLAYEQNILKVQETVQILNPLAIVEILAEQFETVLAQILDRNAFSAEAVQNTRFETLQKKQNNKSFRFLTNNQLTDQKTGLGASHLNQIQAHSFQFEKPFDVLKFDYYIHWLLGMPGKHSIYRSKGILWFEDVEQKVIFQAVNDQYITQGGETWPNEVKPISKLVLIGKDIDAYAVQKGFEQCFAENG